MMIEVHILLKILRRSDPSRDWSGIKDMGTDQIRRELEPLLPKVWGARKFTLGVPSPGDSQGCLAPDVVQLSGGFILKGSTVSAGVQEVRDWFDFQFPSVRTARTRKKKKAGGDGAGASASGHQPSDQAHKGNWAEENVQGIVWWSDQTQRIRLDRNNEGWHFGPVELAA